MLSVGLMEQSINILNPTDHSSLSTFFPSEMIANLTVARSHVEPSDDLMHLCLIFWGQSLLISLDRSRPVWWQCFKYQDNFKIK